MNTKKIFRNSSYLELAKKYDKYYFNLGNP